MRLRRALLVALILGLWAPVKIAWEEHIEREQNLLRYEGLKVTLALRDKLSQGLTFAVLAGMRNIVADMVWLESVTGVDAPGLVAMAAVIDMRARRCNRARRCSGTWAAGNWRGTRRSSRE